MFLQLADFITFDVLGLEGEDAFAKAVHFFVEDITKIFFLITLLMFAVGFLRSFVSTDKVRLWICGKPRIAGYFLAACLGAVTPFCSCSSIPLFIAFLGSGVPVGVAMAFLITSPMVNEVAALLFGEAIGLHFMLAYVATGMLTGIAGGMLADGFKLDKWVEPLVFEDTGNGAGCGCGCGSNLPDFRARLQKAWRETSDIMGAVWLYVIAGVALGAAIHGFVPASLVSEYAGETNLFAVPLAVLAAVPLYSNVTGTVPVVEALIGKGMPVGTTLAFVMSTVAISLPEMVILRRVLMPRMLVFFTLYLVIAFTLVGYGFNLFF